MKKIIGILIVIVFVNFSCSSEFTDVNPVGSLGDTQLQNATGVDLLLTGAYAMLYGNRANGFGNGWGRSADNWVMDVVSDDAHKGSTDGDQADLFELEVYNWATANGYFYAKWGELFAGLNRANGVISLINGLEDSSEFTAQLAQARFLRAHFNFELMRVFGNVPKIDETNFSEVNYNVANTGETKLTWADIEADFTYAMQNLPADRTGAFAQAGRPVSSVAQAYLGKVQLYQSNWASALTNLDAVINSGKYSLNPQLIDNFLSATENGSEALFGIQFSADDAQSFQGNVTGALNYSLQGGWCCGFYQPTQDLVNAYQTENGLPLLTSFQDTDGVTSDYGINSAEAFTLYEGTLDPRLDFTVGRRGIEYLGYGINPGKEWVRATFGDISGPYISKKNVFAADDSNNAGSGAWGQNHSGVNYQIIRYADVLLMAAEAAVETNDLEKARGYVNQVRERAMNMETVKNADGADAANYEIAQYETTWTDAATARRAVRFERRLELGMEGHRMFDLRRWGNAVEVMNAYIAAEGRSIPPFAKGQVFAERNNLFPIPLQAIDGTGGILVQNTGF